MNDQPAKRPIVGVLNELEEMDVRLSISDFRGFFSEHDKQHVDRLLSGAYELEPWVRVVFVGEKWILTAGIECTPTDQEDGA